MHCFLSVLPVVLGLSGTAAAGVIPVLTVPPGGTLTATVANQISLPMFLGLDLRGNSTVAVFDPGFVGAVNVTDLFAPPFPNGILYAENFAATQFVRLTQTGLALVGTELLINEFGTQIGSVTDPALAPMEGPLLFDFTFPTSASSGNVNASFFVLSNVTSVPEPSTLFLGCGAFAFLLGRLTVTAG